MAKILIF